MMCGLCELKTKIHTYDDSDPRWVIIDCMSCVLPMIVWRGHVTVIPHVDNKAMEEALRKVADSKFGRDNYFIDKVQRTIPDHLHWHARPYDHWTVEELRKNGSTKR
tara:strand:+ start:1414 stop:1731 length:318 start_codon:yes stop_codon:yes gene_type:complete